MGRWRNPVVLVAVGLVASGCVIAVVPDKVDGDVVAADVTQDQWRERSVAVTGIERVVMKSHQRLHIVQGDRESLSISGPARAVDQLRVRQSEGVLTIDDPVNFDVDLGRLGAWKYPGPVRIELTVQNLSALDLAGQGEVELGSMSFDTLRVNATEHGELIANAIEAGRLFVTLSDHGEMRVGQLTAMHTEVESKDHAELTVDRAIARELAVRVSGHGNVTLAGVVDQQRVAVDDEADYYGRSLNSRDANVRMRGSAHAHVWVEGQLTTDVARESTLRYEGTPRILAPGDAAIRPDDASIGRGGPCCVQALAVVASTVFRTGWGTISSSTADMRLATATPTNIPS